MRYRKSSHAKRARPSLSLVSSLSPSGTFVFSNQSEHVAWTDGEQGWATNQGLYILTPGDLVSVISNAIVRTTAAPSAATAEVENRFWVKKAYSRISIVNTCQVDMRCMIFPWVVRKGLQNAPILSMYTSTTSSVLESVSASTGTVVGDQNTFGWTPFMSRAFTEYLKLGKPKTVHLQGGQNYVATIRDNRPLYVNFAKLAVASVASPVTSPADSIGGRTRGVFLVFRAIPVNDTNDQANISWSAGTAIVQCSEAYEWVASPMPHRYRDMVPDASALGTTQIIQPQTGAVNSTVTFL